MTSQTLLYIESSQVDYKELLEEKKPRSWLKSVSAFANTHGGHLIFGVQNEPRTVLGLADPQHIISKITEQIKARIDPAPRYRVQSVEIEGKSCVDLEVQNGPAYPYYYAFDGVRVAYVRHGDQSLEDFDLVKDLPSAGLVTPDGQVTNGGLLLCDQGVLKQSRIFCTRWKGNCKGNIDEDALDDKEFQGASLITLLQNAEDFIRNNSKNPWSIRGMRREERSDYPYKAVREVLVNALIHRDYQILGSEIHVDIFDDRLEIFSPGGMMNGQRIQDMDLHHIPSMRRNQIISDVFSRLNLMERRGSGIDRILNSYAEVAQKPSFYSDSDIFLVTLPNRSVANPAQTSLDDVATAAQDLATNLESLATSGQSLATSPEDLVTSQPRTLKEVEQEAFRTSLKNLPISSATRDKVAELFRRYGYGYTFHSSNVADIFGVKAAAATAALRKLRKLEVIESPKYGVYQFVKK